MSGDRWIVVRNWKKFQHRDAMRSAENGVLPWIRFYTRLLHNEEYLSLSWQQRGVLDALFLEYAASDGQLTDNTSTLTRRLGGRVSRVTLESLNHAGFIDFSAGKPPRLSARSEERRLEEKPSPTPPLEGGDQPNGQPDTTEERSKPLTRKQLARFTGCKATRGTHSSSHKYDVLGTDKPPTDWPHPKPSATEITAALNAAARALAG